MSSSTISASDGPSMSSETSFPGPTSRLGPDDDDDDGVFWGNSLSFSIVPVIIIAIAVIVAVGYCIRRRRAGARRQPNWAGISPNDIERANRRQRTTTAPRRGRNWAVWRQDDGLGLNEHGEAPPAYAIKAQPGQSLAAGDPARGETTADLQTSYEMDDMRRPSPGSHLRPGEPSSSSSFSSPPPGAPSSPIAAPAQAHPAPGGAPEPPPPDYGAVTAGSAPPPPTSPHPSETRGNDNNNNSSATDNPLITAPAPAVSFWRSRGT